MTTPAEGPRLVEAFKRMQELEEVVTHSIAVSETRVREHLSRLKAQQEAERRLQEENYTPPTLPEVASLRTRLQRPRQPLEWRIEGWQPVNSRVMLAAQYKSGKTSFVGNLVRSLCDGDPWLDVATVNPPAGPVTILDTEMSDEMIEDWLNAQGIVNDDKLQLVTLRGRVGLFNIIDPRVRGLWVEHLRGTSYLILDCLRPCFDALGLNEDKDAGRFLVAFDALLKEASIPEGMIVQHMGHSAERSRGDSRLRDWPDVEWRLVRENENPSSQRFITAFGRDVNIEESALTWDPDTRHIGLGEGSRKDAATARALPAVLKVLELSPDPLSGRQIEEALSGSVHARNHIRGAVKLGIQRGLIDTHKGEKNATLHTLADQCAKAPTTHGEQAHTDAQPSDSLLASAPNPIGGGAQRTGEDPPVGPRLGGLL